MVIFLINWRILPDHNNVNTFLNKWKTELRIKDAAGLVGEFLSEVKDARFFEFVTWELNEVTPEDENLAKTIEFRSFVNVGVWRSKEDFLQNIGGKFPALPKDMESFEASPRRRALLDPISWRIGQHRLPSSTSHDVSF
jgi:hypothetical protein